MSTPDPVPVDPAVEPVCPRHQDRVSYVRCQRCARPVCPQCQRQAPVGVQCVDCVRAQARTVRAGRTRYGGLVHDGPPRVTYGLIAICVLALVLQLASGGALTWRLLFAPSAAAAEPWRFVTSAFLHSTGFLPHLLLNMLALYQVGPVLEARLGRLRFAATYLVCAVGGSVVYLLLADPQQPSWNRGVVGASGAVFGLFAVWLLDERRRGGSDSTLLGMVAVNFALGLIIPGIAWQSHLGGLVTGAALGGVLMYAPAARRNVVQLGGTVAVVLVLAVLTTLKLSTAG